MQFFEISSHKLVAMRLLGGLCAAILLGAAPLQAQQFDPPDTNYATGNVDDDPAVLQTLPIEQTYRAFSSGVGGPVLSASRSR